MVGAEMKIILIGGSGMVGQGVLRECLAAGDVEQVLAIGRSPLGVTHAKLVELVHADFTNFTPVADRLAGYDACLFCLGVSSAGMTEAGYTRVTFDYTLALARVLAPVSPAMTFIYVSGAGTRTDERGSMWARVKGKTENALLALPFEAAYMFRPGGIQPMHGIKSKTRSYRIAYVIAWPLLPLLKVFGAITTTERVGLAMLEAVRHGAPKPVLSTGAINQLARLAQRS
jgi:uncharacterized protein YbjT (DUF2867 family)